MQSAQTSCKGDQLGTVADPASVATGVPDTRDNEPQPSAPENVGLPKTRTWKRPRTVLLSDVAFQTFVSSWLDSVVCFQPRPVVHRLRTFIFYAYTGRVAFAPLRSQGMIYRDNGQDPSQLPICSPKSMYRFAVKVRSPKKQPAVSERLLLSSEARGSAYKRELICSPNCRRRISSMNCSPTLPQGQCGTQILQHSKLLLTLMQDIRRSKKWSSTSSSCISSTRTSLRDYLCGSIASREVN